MQQTDITEAPFQTLSLRRDGDVLTCTLNRPEARNAVDRLGHRELEDFFALVAEDTSVSAVILTGAGVAFCAGGDLDNIAKLDLQNPPGGTFAGPGIRLIRNLLLVPQPIIAAVNGDAVGIGATLALFCDIVIAAERARIGDPHVNVGLVAGDGGAVIWPLLVGLNRAKEYLMTGDLVPADEAYRIGLVNRVCADDELLADAMATARRLAKAPQPALQWTKRSVNRLLWQQTNLVLELSLALEGLSAVTAEHKETIARLQEARDRRRAAREATESSEAASAGEEGR